MSDQYQKGSTIFKPPKNPRFTDPMPYASYPMPETSCLGDQHSLSTGIRLKGQDKLLKAASSCPDPPEKPSGNPAIIDFKL